jgi:hypothetical protein
MEALVRAEGNRKVAAQQMKKVAVQLVLFVFLSFLILFASPSLSGYDVEVGALTTLRNSTLMKPLGTATYDSDCFSITLVGFIVSLLSPLSCPLVSLVSLICFVSLAFLYSLFWLVCLVELDIAVAKEKVAAKEKVEAEKVEAESVGKADADREAAVKRKQKMLLFAEQVRAILLYRMYAE